MRNVGAFYRVLPTWHIPQLLWFWWFTAENDPHQTLISAVYGTEKVYKPVKDKIFCICGPCICMLYALNVFNFPYVF